VERVTLSSAPAAFLLRRLPGVTSTLTIVPCYTEAVSAIVGKQQAALLGRELEVPNPTTHRRGRYGKSSGYVFHRLALCS
jgi:hypothetical protein